MAAARPDADATGGAGGPGGPAGPGWFCPRCGRREPSAGSCPEDGTPRQPASTRDLVGHAVDRFTLVACLGRGGHGDVYRAIDPRIGAVVALKVVPSVDAAALSRVRREAQAVNRLGRADVARIHDCGALPGDGAYLVMDLVEGETLEQRLLRGPRLDPSEAVLLVRKLLAVLAAAHAAGLVHRDVKPANLMLTADGRVVLLDFGLVKFVELAPTLRLTATGVWVGTPAYMAPEQVKAAAVDARADLYAVAVVLFELLAGRPPFVGGSDFAVLEGHVDQPPPDLRVLCPHVAPALAAVVARGLAKDPDGRWPSAEAFASALAAAPAPTPPAGPASPRRTLAAPGRQRTLLALGIASLGLLAAGIILARAGGEVPARPAPGTVSEPAYLREARRTISVNGLAVLEHMVTTYTTQADALRIGALDPLDKLAREDIRRDLLTPAQVTRLDTARTQLEDLRDRLARHDSPILDPKQWTLSQQDAFVDGITLSLAAYTRAFDSIALTVLDASVTSINQVLLAGRVDAAHRGRLLNLRAELDLLRQRKLEASPPPR